MLHALPGGPISTRAKVCCGHPGHANNHQVARLRGSATTFMVVAADNRRGGFWVLFPRSLLNYKEELPTWEVEVMRKK